MSQIKSENNLFISVKDIIVHARRNAFRSSNSILLQMYWQIGQLIIENEQQGKEKAAYGKAVLKNLSQELTKEFGKGFDERNLNNIRAFYRAFPIWNAVRTELSWTHYRMISRIENEDMRLQYVVHSIEGNWDTRTLQRNINSQYLTRALTLPVENQKQTADHFIKDPYIFEFLGLSSENSNTENNIETAIINHLQKFLMELGKGYAFVARQQHIVTDTSDFFIDLVFYNYYLKCFVLIENKQIDTCRHWANGHVRAHVQ